MAEPQSPMRAALIGLLEPVQKERAQLVERRDELTGELSEINEALRDMDVVINRLKGVRGGKPGPKRKLSTESAAQAKRATPESIEQVRAFLDNGHAPAEFTGTELWRAMDEAGVHPPGTDRVRRSVEELHARGVLTIRRTIRGGAKVYARVGGAS